MACRWCAREAPFAPFRETPRCRCRSLSAARCCLVAECRPGASAGDIVEKSRVSVIGVFSDADEADTGAEAQPSVSFWQGAVENFLSALAERLARVADPKEVEEAWQGCSLGGRQGGLDQMPRWQREARLTQLGRRFVRDSIAFLRPTRGRRRVDVVVDDSAGQQSTTALSAQRPPATEGEKVARRAEKRADATVNQWIEVFFEDERVWYEGFVSCWSFETDKVDGSSTKGMKIPHHHVRSTLPTRGSARGTRHFSC